MLNNSNNKIFLLVSLKKYMIAIKQTYEKIDNLSERNKLLIGIVSEIKQENDK